MRLALEPRMRLVVEPAAARSVDVGQHGVLDDANRTSPSLVHESAPCALDFPVVYRKWANEDNLNYSASPSLTLLPGGYVESLAHNECQRRDGLMAKLIVIDDVRVLAAFEQACDHVSPTCALDEHTIPHVRRVIDEGAWRHVEHHRDHGAVFDACHIEDGRCERKRHPGWHVPRRHPIFSGEDHELVGRQHRRADHVSDAGSAELEIDSCMLKYELQEGHRRDENAARKGSEIK